MSEGEEAIRLGEALATLRRERGMSQAEAGARIGMTSQGWGFYESGKRAGLFRPDMQRRLTSALDATPEDLMLVVGMGSVTNLARSSAGAATAERSVQSAGVEARGRGFEAPPPSGRQYLRLDTDDMSPWAFSGVVLEYVPGQWPRRDQGCIIEVDEGTRLVRLYVGSDAQQVTVRNAAGAVTQFKRSRFTSLSAVTARRDEG